MKKKRASYSVSLREEKKTAIPKAIYTPSRVKDITALENFFYTGHTVLKNKYGIKELYAFKKQCAHDVKRAKEGLHQESLPKRFDFTYLKHIHYSLFKDTFEWAGQSREVPFKFADGTTAYAPSLKKKEFTKPFAVGKEIQQKLDEMDKTLAEKNNLKDLTREEFIEHTAKIMVDLHHAYPFRAGNTTAIQFFIEKLGQAAGHPLDFSLVTKKREELVHTEAMNNGSIEPMKHLLEDISNPQKVHILNEFTNEMEKLGLDKNNYGPVIVAQDGHTYHGTYRGSGQEGFMIDANGTLVLGNKKDLSPKQLKGLKIGDTCSFTAPFPQKSQKILIPEQILAPLSQKEIVDKIQNDLLIQERKKEIVDLCKIVYGKSHVLEETLRKIDANPNTRSEFLGQIDESIKSISKLSGFEICGVKNRARTRAEQNISSLEINLCLYINSVIDLERNIIKDHFAEQKRCNKSVEMPSQQIKGLFSLSKEQQQEALSTAPGLEAKVKEYFQKFSERLSPSEHEAIKQKDYTRLAESLDVSTNQAEQIAKFFKQTAKINGSIESARISKALLEFNMRSSKIHKSSPSDRKKISKMSNLTMKEKYDQEKKEERDVRLSQMKPLRVKTTHKYLAF
ncbi:BID domain-containing T4SS effector [Bartonella sp. B39]